MTSNTKGIPPLPRMDVCTVCIRSPKSATSRMTMLPVSYVTDTPLNSISMREGDLSRDMLQILREENRNLKEQNGYLLGKLHILSDKKIYHEEVQTKHEGIITELRNRNIDLQQQLQQLTHLTKTRMSELGERLSHLASEDSSPSRQTLNKYGKEDMEFSLSVLMEDESKEEYHSKETISSSQIEEYNKESGKQTLRSTDNKRRLISRAKRGSLMPQGFQMSQMVGQRQTQQF